MAINLELPRKLNAVIENGASGRRGDAAADIP